MEPMTKKFIFRLDEETYEQLRILAEQEKSSMGRIVRVLLDVALKKINVSASSGLLDN